MLYCQVTNFCMRFLTIVAAPAIYVKSDHLKGNKHACYIKDSL